MRTNIPEKLAAIVEQIDERGNAPLTKLTVLKKWFAEPDRLRPFAVWVACRASSRKGKTGGAAGELFQASRALLAGVNEGCPQLDAAAAQALHDRLRDFQNEYKEQRWARVRIINNWNLLLVEKGLAIYLDPEPSPSKGYKLAADYCGHYDPRYGSGLNGPSRTKITEIMRFMFTLEALEEIA